MPKQNRPLVRDGRLQVKKKRTERSYLSRSGAAPAPAETSEATDADLIENPAELAEAEAEEMTADDDVALLADVVDVPAAMPPPHPAVPAARPAPAFGRAPTAVRAMQQQGVRKRREFDLLALATRDTQYAFHELRRIAILASMVVVTLIVLGIVLR